MRNCAPMRKPCLASSFWLHCSICWIVSPRRDCPVGLRNQALAQACVFRSPLLRVNAIAIIRQSRLTDSLENRSVLAASPKFYWNVMTTFARECPSSA
jgi:hypothetical protein